MISKRILISGIAAVGMVAAIATAGVVSAQTPSQVQAPAAGATPAQWGPGYGCPGMMQGWGPGPMGGPGMMQQGWGGGPAWGGQGGPGMMQGWGPQGGPGMMQQGWGPQGGPGMMQRGGGLRHAMMGGRGPGRGDPNRVAPWAADGDVSIDDVKKLMEWRLARQNNPNVKIGKIEVKDDTTIVAEIVTAKENALVRQFEIDRKTGHFKRQP